MKQPQIFAYAKRQNVPTWAHGFQMKIRSIAFLFLSATWHYILIYSTNLPYLEPLPLN